MDSINVCVNMGTIEGCSIMRDDRGNELESIEGTVIRQTDLAIHVDFDGTGDPDDYVWLPKSQLEDWPDVGDTGEIMIPQWLAEDKGIV